MSEGDQQRQAGCRLSPPIFFVVAITTLTSTTASLAGGLLMYFESLESLEDTVRETSFAEVGSLSSPVDKVIDSAVRISAAQRAFFYNEQCITSNSSQEWARLTRLFAFSLVHGFTNNTCHCTGVVLVPWDISDGSGMYSMVWAPPKTTASEPEKEYVHGLYAPHMKETHFDWDSSASPPLQAMDIDMTRLDNHTGAVLDTYARADFSLYMDEMLPLDYDPRTGDVPGPGWEKGIESAVAHRWRDAAVWRTSNGVTYRYSSYDAVYAPPPPPHPWSKYRAVLLPAMFMFAYWQAGINEYSGEHPDTTVVILDRVPPHIVYTSTTSLLAEGKVCGVSSVFLERSPLACVTTVYNMSAEVQEAFAELKGVPADTFMKIKLAGAEHFVRKADVHQGAIMIWLRPTTSVEGKVQRALVLLAAFSLLVLVFDVVIAVAEVVLVALPLRCASAAIFVVGQMRTKEALEVLEPYLRHCMMVAEMRRLIEGVDRTVRQLEEFKAFMPETVLFGSDESDVQTAASGPSSGSQKSRSSASNATLNSGPRTAVQGAQLQLSLQERKITVLQLNVVGWRESVLDKLSDEAVLASHTALLTSVLDVSGSSGGVLDHFSGDRFLLSWNASRPRSGHAARACDTVFATAARMPQSSLSTGLATGRAMVGNLGNRTVRRFSFLTPLLSWVVTLERLSKQWGWLCATDLHTVQDLPQYVYRIADALRVDVGSGIVPLVQVLRVSEVANEEWMYQMQAEQQRNAKIYTANQLARHVLQSQWEEAAELAASAACRESTDPAVQLFADAVKNEVFLPLTTRMLRDDENVKWQLLTGPDQLVRRKARKSIV